MSAVSLVARAEGHVDVCQPSHGLTSALVSEIPPRFARSLLGGCAVCGDRRECLDTGTPFPSQPPVVVETGSRGRTKEENAMRIYDIFQETELKAHLSIPQEGPPTWDYCLQLGGVKPSPLGDSFSRVLRVSGT